MKTFIDVKKQTSIDIRESLCLLNKDIENAMKIYSNEPYYLDVLAAMRTDVLGLIDKYFVEDVTEKNNELLAHTLESLNEVIK